MKYHKKLLIVGATFVNTMGNESKIISINYDTNSCMVKTPSGKYNYTLGDIIGRLGTETYTGYKSNFSGNIKDLPEPIKELALAKNPNYELESLYSLINFSQTEEGHNFWQNIYEGDFTPFLEKYPSLLKDKSNANKSNDFNADEFFDKWSLGECIKITSIEELELLYTVFKKYWDSSYNFKSEKDSVINYLKTNDEFYVVKFVDGLLVYNRKQDSLIENPLKVSKLEENYLDCKYNKEEKTEELTEDEYLLM